MGTRLLIRSMDNLVQNVLSFFIYYLVNYRLHYYLYYVFIVWNSLQELWMIFSLSIHFVHYFSVFIRQNYRIKFELKILIEPESEFVVELDKVRDNFRWNLEHFRPNSAFWKWWVNHNMFKTISLLLLVICRLIGNLV